MPIGANYTRSLYEKLFRGNSGDRQLRKAA